MPEGPELFLSSVYVNKLTRGWIFSGQVVKSEVATKNPTIDWDTPRYTIRAESRGKEIKLCLHKIKDDDQKGNLNDEPSDISILFHFGMSGCFTMTSEQEIPKHSHLR